MSINLNCTSHTEGSLIYLMLGLKRHVGLFFLLKGKELSLLDTEMLFLINNESHAGIVKWGRKFNLKNLIEPGDESL